MKNIRKTYLDDGFVILKNAWDKTTIKKIEEEYESQILKIIRRDVPKNQPVVVLWEHVEGEKKKIGLFSEFPKLWSFISNNVVPNIRKFIIPEKSTERLRLLETVVMNKPYETSNIVHWHQDTATWPLKPNNQFAVWIPFESVDKDSGALCYVLGSHKFGVRCAVDLHTNKPYESDTRKPIPENPEKEGFKVQCADMEPTDMLCHHGDTWHCSQPNKKLKKGRRGLSIRFILGDAKIDPIVGQSSHFVIELKKDSTLEGKSFPSF